MCICRLDVCSTSIQHVCAFACVRPSVCLSLYLLVYSSLVSAKRPLKLKLQDLMGITPKTLIPYSSLQSCRSASKVMKVLECLKFSIFRGISQPISLKHLRNGFFRCFMWSVSSRKMWTHCFVGCWWFVKSVGLEVIYGTGWFNGRHILPAFLAHFCTNFLIVNIGKIRSE